MRSLRSVRVSCETLKRFGLRPRFFILATFQSVFGKNKHGLSGGAGYHHKDRGIGYENKNRKI